MTPGEVRSHGRTWQFQVDLFYSLPRLAVASFVVAILVGAVVLSLPVSSASGEWTSPVDALFTATSAVCVTGLIVKPTPHHWSLFGQLAILCMIQAGGLGIMTVYAFMASMLRRRLSMGFERMVGDVVEAHPAENVWGLVKFICVFTLAAEVIGTVCLFLAWPARAGLNGFWQRLYYSVFHSVSAFCNAGFSLESTSLVAYRSDVALNVIFCVLIVVGGLGFLVVRDLKSYAGWHFLVRKGKRPRLGTHTKLVLTMTGMLLLIGFLGIFVMESASSLYGRPLKERVLAAAFQSVTPRTAGFNTMVLVADQGASPASMPVAPSTALLLMALMFVGGSPGSTAGGIKTTTVGVMIASIIASLRGNERAEMFHHSIPQDTVHRVASIILLSVSALMVGVFLLLITEPTARFLEVAFEAASAFGTVGLSLGLTRELSLGGRLIIPALMFIGRLGPVTVMMSAIQMQGRTPYRYPDGQVIVG